MCEFCGCGTGRSSGRPLEQTKTGKKPLRVPIVAAATAPKAAGTVAAARSYEEARLVAGRKAVE